MPLTAPGQRPTALHCRRSRAWLLLVLLLLAAASACTKKAPTTTELRAVTHELVAAAQKVTGRKSEIAIRPEMEPATANGPAQLFSDHIYITLADPAQRAALEEELDQVARRHGLKRAARPSGASVVRFDYVRDSRRTHSIHIITPVAARVARPWPAERGPRLAIILDDLGYDRPAADALLALPFPLTVAVLPHLPFSAEVAEEAYRRGDQVLLHLPMESASAESPPEAIELRAGMSPEEVEKLLEGMLETVPHAAGVNNHQGSRSTADPQLMAAVMPALARHGLFFIDSRTTPETVAYDAAERAGVRAAYRTVFLDDTATREAVLSQLALAGRQAVRQGWAVAIGHPHPGTLAALEEGLPKLEARGIRLVFASDLAQ